MPVSTMPMRIPAPVVRVQALSAPIFASPHWSLKDGSFEAPAPPVGKITSATAASPSNDMRIVRMMSPPLKKFRLLEIFPRTQMSENGRTSRAGPEFLPGQEDLHDQPTVWARTGGDPAAMRD